jgi:hypothetical protein
MAVFNYQYSNLVMMIYKQALIVILIIMAFMVDPDFMRKSIHPIFMIEGAIEPRDANAAK